jgi:hypothetical protein
MKIALCFSGQARSVKSGYEYYKKNLLDKYDVDVYFHTWQCDEIKLFRELYKPVHYFHEKPLTNDADTRYTRTPNAQKYPPRFTYSMFYSMSRVNQILKNTNIDYDWVIRSRTDYALNVQIHFEELDKTKLYIPNCRMVPERDFGNDQFAFGSLDTMVKYMSTFDNIDKYYDAGVQFIGEDLMQANLHEYNLHGENLVYVNMNNPFPPGLHNGTWHSLIRDDYDKWTKTN